MSAWERALQQQKRDDFTRRHTNLPPSLGGRPTTPATPSVGPTLANAFLRESRADAGEGPGLPVGSSTDGRTVTIPKPSDSITTNPGDPFQYDPDPYPTVLPSLSAEQLGQLAERRRLADERLKQAETEKDRRKGLLEASSLRAREDAERMSKRTLEDFMREAGGRGLARSPMVAGRAVRREGEDLRLKYGEIDTRLSTEVMALQDMVSRAASERDIAIAQIEQERVNMQADLDRLFPAAGMFR